MTEKRYKESCDTNKSQTIVQSCFVLILCNRSIVWFLDCVDLFLHSLPLLFASGKDRATKSKAKIRHENEYGQKKFDLCIWSVLWLQNFRCQRQRKTNKNKIANKPVVFIE